MPDAPPMLKKHHKLLELLKLHGKLGKVDGAHEEWLSVRDEIAELQEELRTYRNKEKQMLIAQHEESLIKAERKKAEWCASNPDTNVLYYPSDWWIDTLEKILRDLNSGASDPYSVWDDEYKAVSNSFNFNVKPRTHKEQTDMDKSGKGTTGKGKGMIECAEPFVPSCKWTANPEDYTGHWTTCHNEFTVSDWDEDYNMHSFKFCIFCGAPLSQRLQIEEYNDETL